MEEGSLLGDELGETDGGTDGRLIGMVDTDGGLLGSVDKEGSRDIDGRSDGLVLGALLGNAEGLELGK